MEKVPERLEEEAIKKRIFLSVSELLYEEGLLTMKEKNDIKNRIDQEGG